MNYLQKNSTLDTNIYKNLTFYNTMKRNTIFVKNIGGDFMKQLITSIALLILIQFPFNQTKGQTKINWLSFEEAIKQNEIMPKKIFIDVYTDWCGWCKKMDQETFNNPYISEYLSKNFYCVKFNAEGNDTIVYNGGKFINLSINSRNTHPFAILILNWRVSYPSFVFFSEKLEYLGPISGYKKPKELEPWLVYITENKYKSSSFDNFQKNFISKM